jgi:DNA-binding transcriptional regulator YiaG
MTPDDLRTRRNNLHLTQKQLAAVLGVSTSTVSHWEQGVQRLPRYLDLVLQTLERQINEGRTHAGPSRSPR